MSEVAVPDKARKQPQDRKPKSVAPPSKVKTVNLDGHDYDIDPARMDDLSFLEAYEDEKWVTVLKMMLGPVQWDQFKRNHADAAGRVTGEKFSSIMEELTAANLDLGN